MRVHAFTLKVIYNLLKEEPKTAKHLVALTGSNRSTIAAWLKTLNAKPGRMVYIHSWAKHYRNSRYVPLWALGDDSTTNCPRPPKTKVKE